MRINNFERFPFRNEFQLQYIYLGFVIKITFSSIFSYYQLFPITKINFGVRCIIVNV